MLAGALGIGNMLDVAKTIKPLVSPVKEVCNWLFKGKGTLFT